MQPHCETRPAWLKARVNRTCAETEMIIADCSRRVEALVEKQMSEARKRAMSFRDLADSYDELREALVNLDKLEPSWLTVVDRGLELLAFLAQHVLECFVRFAHEHGPLIDQDLKIRLEESTKWAMNQPKIVKPLIRQYRSVLQADLEASAGEIKAQTAEWDGVVQEGLEADG